MAGIDNDGGSICAGESTKTAENILTDMEMGRIAWLQYSETVRQAALTGQILQVRFDPSEPTSWSDENMGQEWLSNVLLGLLDSEAEAILSRDLDQRLAAGYVSNRKHTRAFPEVDIDDITPDLAEVASEMGWTSINKIPLLCNHKTLSYQAWVESNRSRSELHPASLPSSRSSACAILPVKRDTSDMPSKNSNTDMETSQKPSFLVKEESELALEVDEEDTGKRKNATHEEEIPQENVRETDSPEEMNPKTEQKTESQVGHNMDQKTEDHVDHEMDQITEDHVDQERDQITEDWVDQEMDQVTEDRVDQEMDQVTEDRVDQEMDHITEDQEDDAQKNRDLKRKLPETAAQVPEEDEDRDSKEPELDDTASKLHSAALLSPRGADKALAAASKSNHHTPKRAKYSHAKSAVRNDEDDTRPDKILPTKNFFEFQAQLAAAKVGKPGNNVLPSPMSGRRLSSSPQTAPASPPRYLRADALPPCSPSSRSSSLNSQLSYDGNSEMRARMTGMVRRFLDLGRTVEAIVNIVRPLFPALGVDDWEGVVIEIQNELVIEKAMGSGMSLG